MHVFISVLQGDSPGTAEPVLVTGDPRVIAAVWRELGDVLGTEPTPPRVLSLPRRVAKGDP